MSLIADALKAAQREKDRAATTGAAATRRVLSVFAAARAGELEWPLLLSRQLLLAVAGFGVALALTIVLIAVSVPREEGATVRVPGDAPADQPSGAFATVAEAADAGTGGRGDAGMVDTDTVAPSHRRTDLLAAAPDVTDAETGGRGDAGVAPPSRFQLTMEPLRTESSAWFAQALAAQRRGELGVALELYQRALAEDPENAELHNNLGTVYRALGDYTRARDALRRALKLNPRYASAWSNLAVVLDALQEQEAAVGALQEAIRLDPANTGARVNLAIQYHDRGLLGEARRLLEETLRTDPTIAEAHYALGRVLEDQGERSAAVQHYTLFLSTSGGRFSQLEMRVRKYLEQIGGTE